MRVMPNTPCLVGETASAMCLGGKATEEDADTVRALFSSVGSIVQVQQRTPKASCKRPLLQHVAPHATCAGMPSLSCCSVLRQKDVRRWMRSC